RERAAQLDEEWGGAFAGDARPLGVRKAWARRTRHLWTHGACRFVMAATRSIVGSEFPGLRPPGVPLGACAAEAVHRECCVMNVRVDELKTLPLRQRLQLVEDLWDSIAKELDKAPVSSEVQAEMNRRREAYLRDPSSARDWEDIRRRLEK